MHTELKTKYGLRPRRYNGFFNDSNEAEKRFKVALPKVIDYWTTKWTSADDPTMSRYARYNAL